MTEKTPNEPAERLMSGKPARTWWRGIISSQEIGVLIVLAVMVGILMTRTDTFTSPQNLHNLTLSMSWIVIAGLGQTLVIITAGIDLSTGSVMALSGLAAAYVISGDKSPWAVKQITSTGQEIMVVDSYYVPIALLAGCVMGMFLGAINGVLIAWVGLPPFIATLGMMSITRGVCYGWAEGSPFRQLNTDFREIGQGNLDVVGYQISYPTLVMIALVVVMTIFLTHTIWGYRIYALGGNEQAARLSGINTRRVKLLAYSLSGLMGGIGGTLMTARLSVAAANAAEGYELDVIAAVFIGGASVKGGRGTMIGTLIGAAIMGTLRSGMNLMRVSSYWQPAAIGFTIVLAVIFDRARQGPEVVGFVRRISRKRSARGIQGTEQIVR